MSSKCTGHMGQGVQDSFWWARSGMLYHTGSGMLYHTGSGMLYHTGFNRKSQDAVHIEHKGARGFVLSSVA